MAGAAPTAWRPPGASCRCRALCRSSPPSGTRDLRTCRAAWGACVRKGLNQNHGGLEGTLSLPLSLSLSLSLPPSSPCVCFVIVSFVCCLCIFVHSHARVHARVRACVCACAFVHALVRTRKLINLRQCLRVCACAYVPLLVSAHLLTREHRAFGRQRRPHAAIGFAHYAIKSKAPDQPRLSPSPKSGLHPRTHKTTRHPDHVCAVSAVGLPFS
eukprot:2309981-Pleurochrysis_carterae.AAC.1